MLFGRAYTLKCVIHSDAGSRRAIAIMAALRLAVLERGILVVAEAV